MTFARCFERMTHLQWVNAGFAAAFGWNGPNNLSTPEWLEKLSRPASDTREVRRTIANHFRNFVRDSYSPTPWPWLYGDAMNIPPAPTPRQNVALTNTQLMFLEQWAVGDFDADYVPDRTPVLTPEEVPIALQPELLTKAALDYCLADAFHPGCEMTWPVRSQSMYMSAFRFRHAEEGWIEPSFGEQLISSTLTLANGPLAAQVPGGITRWMAVPWQTDTASCRSGYLKSYDPYVPSFWPARVPNQVLSTASYDVVMDKNRPRGERLAAFANRSLWVRGLGMKSYTDQINNMIHHFGNLGVVEFREGPSDLPLPAAMQVEQLPEPRLSMLLRTAVDAETLAVAPNIQVDEEDVDLTGIEKVQRFPHGLRRD